MVKHNSGVRQSTAITLIPNPDSNPTLGRLDQRERKVLCRLATGLLYKEIADELHVSESVIKKLVHRLFRKMRAHNRTEAIGLWYRQGASNLST
jgi:DNA-binding NarL/FixJ family response regulator